MKAQKNITTAHATSVLAALLDAGLYTWPSPNLDCASASAVAAAIAASQEAADEEENSYWPAEFEVVGNEDDSILFFSWKGRFTSGRSVQMLNNDDGTWTVIAESGRDYPPSQSHFLSGIFGSEGWEVLS